MSTFFQLAMKLMKSDMLPIYGDFPGGSDGKVSVYNVGDLSSIPRSGRSPGEGSGNPLQYYCLENPMDRGAWWATVHGVTKSRTQLSNSTFQYMETTKVFIDKWMFKENVLSILLLFSRCVWLFAIPWTVAHQAPLYLSINLSNR